MTPRLLYLLFCQVVRWLTLLASELRLCGADPVVLERLPAPTGLSKALGLLGRAVQTLDYRLLLFSCHQVVGTGHRAAPATRSRWLPAPLDVVSGP